MPRRRKDESPKVRINLSVSPELVRALQFATELSEVPMSRLVERAVWDLLADRHGDALRQLVFEMSTRKQGEEEAALEDKLRRVLKMHPYDPSDPTTGDVR